MDHVAVLHNLRVTSQPEKYHARTGGDYYAFLATSTRPDKKGLYHKYSLTAWGNAANDIERCKVKKGSCIDCMCEIIQYKKNNVETFGFEIFQFDFSNRYDGNKNENSSAKEEKKEALTKSFMEQLAADPFR